MSSKFVPHTTLRLRGVLSSAGVDSNHALGRILKRSEFFFEHLKVLVPELSKTGEQVAAEVETRIKYEGYIDRQERQVEKLKRMEDVRLTEKIDYQNIHGLFTEVGEKLARVRPPYLWARRPGSPV